MIKKFMILQKNKEKKVRNKSEYCTYIQMTPVQTPRITKIPKIKSAKDFKRLNTDDRNSKRLDSEDQNLEICLLEFANNK